MRRLICGVLIAAHSVFALACADDFGGPMDDGSAYAPLTKAEAREMARTNGKNDQGEDVCALYDWYDDGLCDPWCATPDPDCGACDYPSLQCEVDEVPVDTNETGCADTCVVDPDYHPPHQVPLGELCSYEDDCQEGAYCVKQVGRCDDDEPGVCTLKPDCGGPADFYIAYVCDCEGLTHANQCEAQALGRNLRHSGMCDGF